MLHKYWRGMFGAQWLRIAGYDPRGILELEQHVKIE
jgi:hypothetical protein